MTSAMAPASARAAGVMEPATQRRPQSQPQPQPKAKAKGKARARSIARPRVSGLDPEEQRPSANRGRPRLRG